METSVEIYANFKRAQLLDSLTEEIRQCYIDTVDGDFEETFDAVVGDNSRILDIDLIEELKINALDACGVDGEEQDWKPVYERSGQ